MARNTSKGQRGPRELLHLSKDARQDQSQSSLDDGDWKASRDGANAQAEPVGQVEGWIQFVHRVTIAQHHYKNKLRTVWHPSPVSMLIHLDNGNIVVRQGAVQGQLNTGQFVDL